MFRLRLAQVDSVQLRPFQASLHRLKPAQAGSGKALAVLDFVRRRRLEQKGTPPPAAGAMWSPVSISHRWPNEVRFSIEKVLAWKLFGSDGFRRQFGGQLAQAGSGQLRPFQASLDQLRLAQAKRQRYWISSAAGG